MIPPVVQELIVGSIIMIVGMFLLIPLVALWSAAMLRWLDYWERKHRELKP